MRYSTQTLALSKKIGIKGAVKAILDAGFSALDMTMSYGEERWALGEDYASLANDLRKMAADRGAVFNQAHAPFGGGREFYTEKTAKNFPRIFEFAAMLGSECIVVHPVTLDKYNGHEEELFEINMDFYNRLLPYARDVGIKIAIENMWQENEVKKIVPSVCHDSREHAKYFDALGNKDDVTLCLDVGHIALAGANPAEAVKILGTRLGATHIHDVDLVSDLHTMPGLGKIDWESLACALGEINYSGYLTLECDKGYLKDVTEDTANEKLRNLRECVSMLGEKVDTYRKTVKNKEKTS